MSRLSLAMIGKHSAFAASLVVPGFAVFALGCNDQPGTQPTASGGAAGSLGSGGDMATGGTDDSSGALGSSGTTGSSGAAGSAESSGGAGGLAGTAGEAGSGGGDSGGVAGAGGDMGAGGVDGTGPIDAGPSPGCNLNGTFAGLDFINTAFVASQYQPSGAIPFKQSACNDVANAFSSVAREAAATGACFAGQVDVAMAKTAALTWVAAAWLHYDAGDNKGYPDPYPVDPMKNPGTDAICLAKKVVIRAKASIDDLLVSFAAGDATWEGTASNVMLKKDTWTEVTMTFTGWPQLPIFRGFYFGIAIDQEALTSVTTPIELFFDSGKYL